MATVTIRNLNKNYENGLWERMMPAILLTLISRTQTLVVENNPGGRLLALDPYDGHIAETAHANRVSARFAVRF